MAEANPAETTHDPEAVAAAWVSTLDPGSGQTYYYNSILQTSSWTNPFPESANHDSPANQDSAAEPEISQTIQRQESATVKLVNVNWGATEEEVEAPTTDSVGGDNPFFQSSSLRSASSAAATAPDLKPQTSETESQLALPEKSSSKAGGVSFGGVVKARMAGKELRKQVSLGDEDVSDVHSFNDTDAEESKTQHQGRGTGVGRKSAIKNSSSRRGGAVPPPALSVPVDALARAGERSDKWLEYVKKHVMLTGHVSAAGIFDLRNCARWAATQDFLPRHYHIMDSATGAHHGVNEAASTVFLMKSGSLPKHGLRFNGVLYHHESTEVGKGGGDGAGLGVTRWAVSGTKERPGAVAGVDPHWGWAGGIVLVRTCRALVVATYDTGKGHDGSVCRAAVEGLAAFMTDYAC